MNTGASKDSPYTGGCLCGAVRFEISGPIKDIVMCHCSQCRKVQGSAYATNGRVADNEFVIVAGEENLTAYPSSDDQTKYFCCRCGSPILSRRKSLPGEVRVRLGTIESDIVERPQAHIYVGSKANWDSIPEGLPSYEENLS